MKQLLIAIFAHSNDDFLKSNQHLQSLIGENINGITLAVRHCHSEEKSRLHFLNENLNQWILFIDADCELPEATLLEVTHLLRAHTGTPKTILTGCYLNPAGPTYLQVVHNFIANSWVRSGFEAVNSSGQTEPYLLGGIFLIYTLETLILKAARPYEIQWGAEDKILSLQLIQAGYEIKYSSELQVIHRTSKSWKHFIRRAFLHGRNDPIRKNQQPISPAQFQFWFVQLKSQDIIFLPAIGVHFLFLRLGRWSQKFPQVNKSKLLIKNPRSQEK